MKTILFLVMGWVLILAGFYSLPKIVSAQDDLQLGERVYEKNCAACHGEKGDGKKPQAYKLRFALTSEANCYNSFFTPYV